MLSIYISVTYLPTHPTTPLSIHPSTYLLKYHYQVSIEKSTQPNRTLYVDLYTPSDNDPGLKLNSAGVMRITFTDLSGRSVEAPGDDRSCAVPSRCCSTTETKRKAEFRVSGSDTVNFRSSAGVWTSVTWLAWDDRPFNQGGSLIYSPCRSLKKQVLTQCF